MSMSEPQDRQPDQSGAAFALPADRLPLVIRATDRLRSDLHPVLHARRHRGPRACSTTGPLIIASNHLSNADPPLIACWLTPALGRAVHWMAKQEALEWPIAGAFLKAERRVRDPPGGRGHRGVPAREARPRGGSRARDLP